MENIAEITVMGARAIRTEAGWECDKLEVLDLIKSIESYFGRIYCPDVVLSTVNFLEMVGAKIVYLRKPISDLPEGTVY